MYPKVYGILKTTLLMAIKLNEKLIDGGDTGLNTNTRPSAIPIGRLHPSQDHRCPLPPDTLEDFPCCASDLFHACCHHYPGGILAAKLLSFHKNNGLPRYCGGSAPTTTFRGLLSVHSRYGPHGPLISQADLFL